ncbi:MAG: hypothetical protein JWQ01_1467 [Massilia sp.]|nr:hypothetical protein [Massilia sp.]
MNYIAQFVRQHVLPTTLKGINMTNNFDSIAEGKAAPSIAALGGFRCDTFAPLLSQTYEDAAGVELTGKPDSLIRYGNGFIFIDTKSGILNHHHTQAASTNAMKKSYRVIMGRYGDHLSHSELSTALYNHNYRGQSP